MIKMTLKRKRTGDKGTFGKLYIVDERICYTLELPWKDNQPNISCIPAGEYLVTRHESPHFGDVFKVHDVPDRTDILIHIGNYLDDTEGCILVGLKKNDKAVIASRVAFVKLKTLLGDEPVELTITEDYIQNNNGGVRKTTSSGVPTVTKVE
jgi:hypothetical protein